MPPASKNLHRSGLSCAAEAFGASHRDHHAPLNVKQRASANVQGQGPRQRWIDNKHGTSMLRLPLGVRRPHAFWEVQ